MFLCKIYAIGKSALFREYDMQFQYNQYIFHTANKYRSWKC